MTRFTVTWHHQAVNDLAAAWIDSPHRHAFAKSVSTIDASLAYDPSSKGTEFYGDRLLVVLPLAVVFTVHQENRMVRVLAVWTSKDGPPPA